MAEAAITTHTAAMPLAWMRHKRAAATLRAGYHRERDSETKARILYLGVNLMSEAAEALLQDARRSEEVEVREAAAFLRPRNQVFLRDRSVALGIAVIR